VHPWDAEFSIFLQREVGLRFQLRSLYLLEQRFLSGLDYRVNVSSELYGAYYFALHEPSQSSDALTIQAVQRSLSSGCLERSHVSVEDDEDAFETAISVRGLSDADTVETPPWTPSRSDFKRQVSDSVAIRQYTSESESPSKHQRLRATTPGTLKRQRLETSNPYVGFFHHAPPASLPPVFSRS